MEFKKLTYRPKIKTLYSCEILDTRFIFWDTYSHLNFSKNQGRENEKYQEKIQKNSGKCIIKIQYFTKKHENCTSFWKWKISENKIWKIYMYRYRCALKFVTVVILYKMHFRVSSLFSDAVIFKYFMRFFCFAFCKSLMWKL